MTVRKVSGGFELVAGERRLRAARIAGLAKVPAIVQEMKEDTAAAVARLENIQREDVYKRQAVDGMSKAAAETVFQAFHE